MDYFENITDVIGNTPLVRLGRIEQGEGIRACILAKLEYMNPGGSVKDRPAVKMLEVAEKEGLLNPGGTVVEPTSGNTGAGLALAAAIKGYRCVCVMPDKVSKEKQDLLKALGAEVVVTSTGLTPDDPESYYAVAERLAREIPGGFKPGQYENPANPHSHYETTGPEIWEQTNGEITHFVAGLGTSGTFVGTARRLKEYNPDIKVTSFEPESPFHGLEGMKHMESAIVPPIYDPAVADENRRASTEEAYEMVKRVAREEGVLIGISSGAAVATALEVAREIESGVVVTILCDGADKYLSERFWEED